MRKILPQMPHLSGEHWSVALLFCLVLFAPWITLANMDVAPMLQKLAFGAIGATTTMAIRHIYNKETALAHFLALFLIAVLTNKIPSL